jgi:molybdate/tungstate transport system substrate-binding protein
LKVFAIFIVFVQVIFFGGCKDRSVTEITVFHAGSLAKPFKDMKDAFEKENPNVRVLLEAAGSRASARKITDLKRNADVMASADEHVIRTLLMPGYADWAIRFVTNEMVLIFTEKSKYHKEITKENWFEVLLREGVNYGHSEPELDPCGYRTLLVWQLAEKHYRIPGLYDSLDAKRPKKHIRPKETDLLSLLEFGELDFVFMYRSVAIQHRYSFIELPKEINLGYVDKSEFYKQAAVTLTGKTPGEKIEITGEPMVYGITVPQNGLQKEWGIRLVEFILSPAGQKIMSDNGHPVINPAESFDFDKLPKNLKKLSVKKL